MNFLLVTFSLRNQMKDYGPFFVELRGNSLQWCHYIEQTMIVFTPLSTGDLYRKLLQHIELTDSLLILPMPEATQLAGILPKDAWEWLHKVGNEIKAQKALPFLPPITLPPRLK